MRRAIVTAVAAGLVLCGLVCGQNQQADRSSAKAVRVFVTYHGPEQLTRRYSRFFSIAADDFGVTIVDRSNEADAHLEVWVKDEERREQIHGQILHAGIVLRDGKSASIHTCIMVSNGDDPGSSNLLGYLTKPPSIAVELKRDNPSVHKIFFDPIKGNLEPYALEAFKKNLVKEGYTLAPRPEDADAVLKSIGTTWDPIEMKAIKRSADFVITGSVHSSGKGGATRYQSIAQPVSETAKPCLASAQNWLYPHGGGNSDEFWGSASSAAKALAKF